MDLNSKIRRVPDFPKKGIEFYDVTTVMQEPEAFHEAIDLMKNAVEKIDCDIIVALEARGFLFAAPIAYALNKSLVVARKKGKLPYKTVSVEYALEYGSDCFELHEDAVKPGQKVVIIDDLLATGGTTKATQKLVEKLGGKVNGMVYFIEIEDLNGRNVLDCDNIVSLVKVLEHSGK